MTRRIVTTTSGTELYVLVPASLFGSSITMESDGGMSLSELSDNITLEAGTNVVITGTAAVNVTGPNVNINTTGSGLVSIGNTDNTVTLNTWATTQMASSKYNILTHLETGYSGAEERDRYWFGTTSGVGPTILTGSFSPSTTFAPSNSLIRIVTNVLGCDATGANSIGVTVMATYKKVSGTLSLVTSTELNKHQTGGTGTAAAHTAVSGEIRLSVTGIAATNIRWEAYSTVYYCKSF